MKKPEILKGAPPALLTRQHLENEIAEFRKRARNHVRIKLHLSALATNMFAACIPWEFSENELHTIRKLARRQEEMDREYLERVEAQLHAVTWAGRKGLKARNA